jgi:anti-sigma-K factor RskA
MICLNKNERDTAILLDYCAGKLDAERTGAIEDHARECAECRALIAAQMNVWRALGELAVPEVSPDFDARLYARIAQEEAASSWRAWLRSLTAGWRSLGVWSWKPVLAGVAAGAVVAVGLSLYMPILHVPQSRDSSLQFRPDSVDVEQVEVTLEDLDMLTPPAASTGQL